MRQIRRLILTLVASLSALFVIDRFALLTYVGLDLQPFMYLLIPCIILFTVGLPTLRRASLPFSILAWTGILILLAMPDLRRPSIAPIGYNYAPLFLTELLYVWFTALLAHYLANGLRDFERAIEKITLATAGAPLRDLAVAAGDVQSELARSRRYRRPLSVFIVEPAPGSVQESLHRMVQEVQQGMTERIVAARLGHVISTMLRRTDMMLWQGERGRLIMLCPEMDSTSSKDLVERIQSAAAERIGLKVNFAERAFSDGAVTFDELMAWLESPLESSQESPIPSGRYGAEATKTQPLFMPNPASKIGPE